MQVTATAYPSLPALADQSERLIELGVHDLLNVSASDLRGLAGPGTETVAGEGHKLLVPGGVDLPYSKLMSLVALDGNPGFVVEDFTDVAEFIPTSDLDSQTTRVTDADWYLLEDPQRGDEYRDATPQEASLEISAKGRVPLTIMEGIFWALQIPEILERNRCFMTIGSRKPKPARGFDSRTPALWISNGTGRDGPSRRNAAKLGWCWWNNRHTWLGIAHAANRTGA